VQVAINGGFFEPFRPGFVIGYEPNSGDPVNMKGLSISNGETYSQDQEYADYPALCLVTGKAQIREGGCPPGTAQALAGTPLLVERGAPGDISGGAYHTEPHPRTVVAVDAKGETLWLIVVDGRQRNYSEGATLAELVGIILELGADSALNLDGGGSTTLVTEGAHGAVLLNSPIHTRIPMRQRPVGNHLGVYALPIK
jgi:exopolysaccharide biosynthesis protein